MRSFSLFALNLALLASLLCIELQAQEIGFIENFALSNNRSETLSELVPGTEDYYYFHCLHYQNSGQLDRVEPLLKTWVKRFGETTRVRVIRNRQALLNFDKDPQGTYEYLEKVLKLRFDHQRHIPDAQRDLPVQLDPKQIAVSTLLQRALAGSKNTDGINEAGLELLAKSKLDKTRRRHLLSRLRHPDFPDLTPLIVADLKERDSKGFGSLPIHKMLTLDQLQACRTEIPALSANTNFVQTYLSKLQSSADVNWNANRDAHIAYLERLRVFTNTLPPSFNSLKANILFRLLALNRRNGNYNSELFMDYLKLPRQSRYANPQWLKQAKSRDQIVNLNADFSGFTKLPPILDDQDLLQDYLHHFLKTADDFNDYAPYLRGEYLKEQFATVKILHGIGDVEKWASMLTPGKYQQLLQRIDLEFALTNREFFADEDTVSIDLYAKNINKVIVKVFEINAFNYYRKHGEEIDTNISLDGLVPNFEKTYEFTDPPSLRVKRNFVFDQLTEQGVYIIDFIAGGKSSRALIRRGRLTVIGQPTAAGQQYRVVDHNQQLVQDASLWISGRKYQPTENGLIVVPFTNSPSQQMAIIRRGNLSSLQQVEQKSERYALDASLYVDRESLIRSEKANLIIRPRLTVSGLPTSVKLLQEPHLSIVSTSLDGVSSTAVYENLQLNDQSETSIEFTVPPRLNSLTVTLQGKVENRSQNQQQPLQVSRSYTINQIDATDSIQDVHLMPTEEGYWLEIRGKSGELRGQQPVRVTLQHHDFKEPVHANLQSDQKGLVYLGSLQGIQLVSATIPGTTTRQWNLAENHETQNRSVHMQQGKLVQIIAPFDLKEINRDRVSLTEVRGGQFTQDRFSHLQLADGIIQLVDLPAGDYLLRLKIENRNFNIRICDGPISQGVVLGRYRQLEIRDPRPLTIKKISPGKTSISIDLENANPDSRVLLIASRYQPGFRSFPEFARIKDVEPLQFQPAVRRSVYLAGRQIGDEFQYILDRKYAAKYPGNMLERPSLLVSPWAVRDTNNNVEVLAQGDQFGGVGGNDADKAAREAGAEKKANGLSDASNLDYLADSSVVSWNLKPDDQGNITIDRKQLGGRQYLRLITLDDHTAVQRDVRLAGQPAELRDLRLAYVMDPKQHFCQTKQVQPMLAGERLEISDLGSAKYQIFNELSDVYQLFQALNPAAGLDRFQFILDWDSKTDAQKQALYSEHACHELNFFLYKKDPRFFQRVILPNLQQKRNPQFMDQYLLGQDLSRFLKPWHFARLNVTERVLLAQRNEAKTADIVRSLNDLYSANPTTREQFDSFYAASLAYNGLKNYRAGRSRAGQNDLPKLFSKQDQRGAEASAGLLDRDAANVEDAFDEEGGDGMNDAPSSSLWYAAPPQSKAAQKQLALAGRAFQQNRQAFGDDKTKAAQQGQSLDMAGRGRLQQMEREVLELENLMAKENAADRQLIEQLGEQQSVLYRRLPATKEWIENNYYRLIPEQQSPDLVPINRFWRDYASHQGGIFLSPYFAEANKTFAEMMLALAVLDLPAEAEKPDLKYADDSLTIEATGPMITLHQQVKPTVIKPGNTSILISENYFLNRDRYRFDDGMQYDKFVEDDFLAHELYGAQVVITNPTSTPRSVDLLIQIPQGAVTANGSQNTRSIPLQLDGFSTQTFEYYFYFPTAGQFTHYPAHVSSNEEVLAFAPGLEFVVVDRPAELDQSSWEFVSQNGSPEEVIEFLNQNNLLRHDLSKIAFRMKDKVFFDRVIRALKNRYLYNHLLWSYGIHHGEASTTGEYLMHDKLNRELGSYLKSPLLDVLPTERNWYYHREYSPLVNPRAHRIGQKRTILNPQFHTQYTQLMDVLAHHPELSADDHLVVTYYLLLQDRVDEAMAHFAQVDRKAIPNQMPYDYCDAYLDLYREDPEGAAAKAAPWIDYPVDRWRARFQAIAAQVDEIRGGSSKVVDPRNATQIQTELASQEESFDFKIESGKILLDSQNLDQITANFYEIDIELLFSRSPFSQDNLDGFSVIRPNQSADFTLDRKQVRQRLSLPDELQNKNVLVELVAGDQVQAKPYFANSLAVQVSENYGQMRIADAATGKPLPRTYIKVYARSRAGEIRFHKDGYTDLRGRFDYVSQSNNPIDDVERYAILVFSEDQGATVRQVAPPAE